MRFVIKCSDPELLVSNLENRQRSFPSHILKKFVENSEINKKYSLAGLGCPDQGDFYISLVQNKIVVRKAKISFKYGLYLLLTKKESNV